MMQGYGAAFANRMQQQIAKHDIVQLAGGAQMIVIDIVRSRPSNPFVGVKVNGKGTAYKFGPKHAPRVIGKADANHPALRARAEKTGAAPDDRLEALARLVVAGKSEAALDLANSILAVID